MSNFIVAALASITLSLVCGLVFHFVEPSILTKDSYEDLYQAIEKNGEFFKKNYKLTIDRNRVHSICWRNDDLSYPVYISKADNAFVFTYLGPSGERTFADNQFTANRNLEYMLFGNSKDIALEKRQLLDKIMVFSKRR